MSSEGRKNSYLGFIICIVLVYVAPEVRSVVTTKQRSWRAEAFDL